MSVQQRLGSVESGWVDEVKELNRRVAASWLPLHADSVRAARSEVHERSAGLILEA